ncbi:MAG: hypothetical protein JWL76_1171 [Thermoleophilia bacterium]|nr:hypothetical protein [Thermoleophilia bacterium]
MALGGIINAGDTALGATLGAAATDLATGAAELATGAADLATGAAMHVDEAATTASTAGLSATARASEAAAGADAIVAKLPDGFIHRAAADVPEEDWATFARALASDPNGTILHGPRSLFEAPDLRLVVDKIRLGHQESMPVADRYFAAWRALEAGPEAVQAQSHALLTRNPQDLASDDWKTLASLVDADPTGTLTKVPAMERREYAGLRQTIVDLATGVRTDVGDQAQIQFHRWVRDNDPSYPAKWDAAVEGCLNGPWTKDRYWTLRLEAENFDELGPRLPSTLTPDERNKVLWWVADRNTTALAGWIQRHDPEYPKLVQEAIAAKLADENKVTSLQYSLVSTAKDDIEALTAGLPFEEAQPIAKAVLHGANLSDWLRAHDPTWTQTIERKLDAYLAGDSDYKVWGPLRDEGDHLNVILAKRPFAQQRDYWAKTLNTERYVEWVRANDPDLAGTVRAALDESLAGTISERGRKLLEAESGRIDEFLAGKPYEEQDRIARAMLHRNDYYEWNLGHNPENRVKVDAAIQRVINDEPKAEGDGLIFVQEKDRIDQLTAGHPLDMQRRIAKAVLGEQSLWYTEWMQRADPDRVANLNAAADGIVAGADDVESGPLYWLRTDLPNVVFGGRSVVDNLKIIAKVNSSGTASDMVKGWRAALEPELSRLQHRAAADAAVGELSDDARLLLKGEVDKLDELTAGGDYETSLRIADAVLDARSLQEWKVAHDTDRVARVTRSANAIADGSFTQHDMRVLRGETDVLGTVRDRPYAQRLQVAEVALDRGSIGFWKRANDPTYQARIAAAIDEVEAGALTPEGGELIASDRPNVFRHLGERSPATQSAVAAAMLGRETASFQGIQAAMRDLAIDASTRLKALPDVEMTRELRTTTTEMLDRNIQRMTNFFPNDPNRGYARHPDYAEMGRVQTNLELLEAMAKGQTTAASAKEALDW